MDARLVWDTWRRILTSDELVELALRGREPDPASSLSVAEMAILKDYASTPTATETNIDMYRSGLVRNALAALSFTPLTRRLFYFSGLDASAVAEDFSRSNSYRDDGPNFWRIAEDFVVHLAQLPAFASPLRQDVIALEAATAGLFRRLGECPASHWPESAALNPFCAREVDRYSSSRAAVVASSNYDLTTWLEDPQNFDADEDLELSTKYWLIYVPSAEATHTYAELSERAARAFNLLCVPKTPAELSSALDGLPLADVLEVINSLAGIGTVLRE